MKAGKGIDANDPRYSPIGRQGTSLSECRHLSAPGYESGAISATLNLSGLCELRHVVCL